MCSNDLKVRSGHVYVVSGAHVRVLTPVKVRHFSCKLCMNIKDACFDKSDIYFQVHVKMAFCAHINCPVQHFDTLRYLRNSLHMCV